MFLSSSHISSFDSFPRLDPPPPSGKKRLPRALKTTQDMMISSDPVVASPDPADSSSFLSSPDKTPLIAKEELRNNEEQPRGRREEEEEEEDGSEELTLPPSPAEKKRVADCWETTGGDGGAAEVTGEGEPVVGGEEEHQPQLSVPDLINKETPPEAGGRPRDVWQRAEGSRSRLASTPCPDKTPCRVSLGEEVLLGNGAPCSKSVGVSAGESESHPDLLMFE